MGDENKVKLVSVTAKTRGPMLDNGTLDAVIATFTITDERKKTYDYTTPYYKDAVGLLVRKDGGVNTLKDLEGGKIEVSRVRQLLSVRCGVTEHRRYFEKLQLL